MDVIVKYPTKRIKNEFTACKIYEKNKNKTKKRGFLEIVLCKSATQIFRKIPEKFLWQSSFLVNL